MVQLPSSSEPLFSTSTFSLPFGPSRTSNFFTTSLRLHLSSHIHLCRTLTATFAWVGERSEAQVEPLTFSRLRLEIPNLCRTPTLACLGARWRRPEAQPLPHSHPRWRRPEAPRPHHTTHAKLRPLLAARSPWAVATAAGSGSPLTITRGRQPKTCSKSARTIRREKCTQ